MPGGTYVLEVHVNPQHIFDELDLMNNVTRVPVVIPNDPNACIPDPEGDAEPTGGKPRMDLVNFTYHHALAPLVSDETLEMELRIHKRQMEIFWTTTPATSRGWPPPPTWARWWPCCPWAPPSSTARTCRWAWTPCWWTDRKSVV